MHEVVELLYHSYYGGRESDLTLQVKIGFQFYFCSCFGALSAIYYFLSWQDLFEVFRVTLPLIP